MADVNTNDISLLMTEESALGTEGTVWETLDINDIPKAGPETVTVARNPISKLQQRRGGEIVDLKSTPEYTCDLTMGNWRKHLKYAFFSKANGPTEGLADGEPFRPTAVTTTGYTVASGGDIPNNYLIVARGFPDAANNGLKKTAGTSTATEIKTTGLVADAAVADSENATVEICGYEALSDDLEIDASGNLISTHATTPLDFTTLGLTVGQFIKIGGKTSGTEFATAAYNGTARVTKIEVGKLTLDRRSWTVGAADAGAGKTIRIFFGPFFRHVAVDNADYVRPSATFELAFPELGGAGVPEYMYPKGNRLDELAVQLPLAAMSGMTAKWVGLDTPKLVTVRKTGAADARKVIQDDAINTSSRFIRKPKVYDSAEAAIVTYMKSADLMLKNGIKSWGALGDLGAVKLTRGNSFVDMNCQMAFDDSSQIDHVRDYTRLMADFGLAGDDGGFIVDMPSIRLATGSLSYPRDELVLFNAQIQAEIDVTYQYSASVSVFPYLP